MHLLAAHCPCGARPPLLASAALIFRPTQGCEVGRVLLAADVGPVIPGSPSPHPPGTQMVTCCFLHRQPAASGPLCVLGAFWPSWALFVSWANLGGTPLPEVPSTRQMELVRQVHPSGALVHWVPLAGDQKE